MTTNKETQDTCRPSVLVVDDEYLNIKLAVACLSQEGFAVRGASDADAALKAIDQAVPEVILLDIMMPGVDGYTLCRRLKNRRAHPGRSGDHDHRAQRFREPSACHGGRRR